MAINLKLYNYTAERWVANKLSVSSMATPVFDSTGISNFNVRKSVFTPLRAEFILSALYSANYCSYVFNGITYYGYLTIATEGDGLYLYTVDVDALTTAWYAGCMAATTLISFSQSYGGSFEVDSRRKFKPYLKRGLVTASGNYSTPAVVMVLFNPYVSQSYSLDYDQSPGGYEFWVFQPFNDGSNNVNAISNYNRFVRNAAKRDLEQKYLNPILSTYVLPSIMCPSDTNYDTIEIYSTVASITDVFTNGHIQIPSGGTIGTVTFEDYAACGYTAQSAISRFSKDILFMTYPYRDDPLAYECPWTITVPFIGSVSFNPKEAGLSGYNYVGVRIHANLVGGFWTVQLAKRKTASSGLEVVIANNWAIPFSEEMYTINASAADQKTISMISSMASATAAAASGNYASLAGSVINTISTASNGGLSLMGNNKGTPYRSPTIADTVPTLVIPYYEYEEDDGSSYNQRYGYPCDQLLQIDSLTGYTKTAHAELYHLGLPSEIVKAAEDALDAGVFIL